MTEPYQRFNADKFINRPIDFTFGSLLLMTESQAELGVMAFLRAGKKADVVRGEVRGRDRAVKVFKRRFAIPENAVTTEQLRRFRGVPGLTVCDRQVIRGSEIKGRRPDRPRMGDRDALDRRESVGSICRGALEPLARGVTRPGTRHRHRARGS